MDSSLANKNKRLLDKIKTFLHKNVVFVIALIFAGISCIFVPFDRKYLSYFDYRTLTCLFCMMLVICSLRNIWFFRIMARKIVVIFKNTRSAITALIFITFVGSMLIANDMALITFLPLSIIVLKSTGNQKYMCFTFIMQNIAANLGGMLTPFGNPQNLFLYNYFNIPNGEFFLTMLPPFLISIVIIGLSCLFVKPEKLSLDNIDIPALDWKRTTIYFILFVYSILIVFRVVPFWSGFLMIPIIFIFDRKSIFQVDYFLLLTFCLFFIFSGNISRIPAIQSFLSYLVQKNTLLVGVGLSQMISNVPTAILLSSFVTNYKPLLIAVNIGGCGTLVSSLASLITFKEFSAENNGKVKSYLISFHLINFSFLAVLILSCVFLF